MAWIVMIRQHPIDFLDLHILKSRLIQNVPSRRRPGEPGVNPLPLGIGVANPPLRPRHQQHGRRNEHEIHRTPPEKHRQSSLFKCKREELMNPTRNSSKLLEESLSLLF